MYIGCCFFRKYKKNTRAKSQFRQLIIGNKKEKKFENLCSKLESAAFPQHMNILNMMIKNNASIFIFPFANPCVKKPFSQPIQEKKGIFQQSHKCSQGKNKQKITFVREHKFSMQCKTAIKWVYRAKQTRTPAKCSRDTR